jgi:hypothetical protein
MSACIIMLDFDGVTHPDNFFDANFFCRLPLIEEVLRKFPSVKIVISSSWREHHSLDDIYLAPRLLSSARQKRPQHLRISHGCH